MKKKVMFMAINMNLGGTEKALINMLYELPADQFDITVLLLERRGSLLSALPDHVHVLELDHYQAIKHLIQQPPVQSIRQLARAGKLVKAGRLAGVYGLAKIKRDRRLLYHYILKSIPNDHLEYDLAVAYAGPMDLISYFIAHKVKANKKVQWIHFDIENIGFDTHFARKLYGRFQQIFIVSEEGRRKFIQHMPALEHQTDVFPNVLSTPSIIKQAAAGDGFSDQFTGIRLLTVGRLSHEKGQDMAIEALSELVRDGFDIRWYFVGTGPKRDVYEQIAIDKGLSGHAVFLGEQLNPYPYMKQCDLYVQPSRHEGYCITLAEAKLFHKPIVTTDFAGAREQIKEQQTGVIVEPDARTIYQGVKNLLNQPALQLNFQHNLAEEQAQTCSPKKLLDIVK